MVSAAHRHSILIVGVGSIGERHLRCFLATNRAHVAFVEVRDDLRAEIAARYPTASAYASLDAALADKFTGAVIATPAPLHVPLATRLAEGGLHVLIEKPLSIGLEGVAALVDLVERRGSLAAVAYIYRAHPVLAEMREAVLSGQFGQPVELVAASGQHFPLYRPAYRQTYYVSRATGGGAIQDALTHLLNAGEWLLGPNDRVVADAAHQVLEGTEVEDTVHVLARHGAVLASYALNQHQAPNETSITVVCQRGTVRFENHLCRWRSMEQPGGEWADHPHPVLERDSLFIRQADSFLDAIEGNAAPLCDLHAGLATLRTNLAILQSVEKGGWQPTRERSTPA